jgi:HAD superfamily hydrolase (TIGR01509 family)
MGGFAAVLFDMDGLMFTTEKCYFQANQELLGRRGQVYSEDLMRRAMGSLGLESMKIFIQEFSFDEDPQALLEERTMLVKKTIRESAEPCKGLFTLLEKLERCKIKKAVATSSRKMLVDLLLEKFGLFNRFDAIVTGEEVERGKPAPDIFLLAAKKLGVEPRETIVLEDAPKGIAAAKAGGFFAVLVPHAYSGAASEMGPNLTVEALDDERLLGLLK